MRPDNQAIHAGGVLASRLRFCYPRARTWVVGSHQRRLKMGVIAQLLALLEYVGRVTQLLEFLSEVLVLLGISAA